MSVHLSVTSRCGLHLRRSTLSCWTHIVYHKSVNYSLSTVVQQLARFWLTQHIVRSICDSRASCANSLKLHTVWYAVHFCCSETEICKWRQLFTSHSICVQSNSCFIKYFYTTGSCLWKNIYMCTLYQCSYFKLFLMFQISCIDLFSMYS